MAASRRLADAAVLRAKADTAAAKLLNLGLLVEVVEGEVAREVACDAGLGGGCGELAYCVCGGGDGVADAGGAGVERG
jgi:hypothetical protein|tara:strand:+ start:37686 stop:37919 length:234 start_codon:yes stop_codon:yes gene_type:complete